MILLLNLVKYICILLLGTVSRPRANFKHDAEEYNRGNTSIYSIS